MAASSEPLECHLVGHRGDWRSPTCSSMNRTISAEAGRARPRRNWRPVRIALARLRSAFSRFRRLSPAGSSDVTPARAPASTSA